jgi:hypothetical protein
MAIDIPRSLVLAALMLGCTTGTGTQSSAVTIGTDGAPSATYESASQRVYESCDFPATGACKCTQTTWCSPNTDCLTQTGVVNTTCDTRAFANGQDCNTGCGPYCRSSTACVTYSCTTAEGCADAVPIRVRDPDDDDRFPNP